METISATTDSLATISVRSNLLPVRLPYIFFRLRVYLVCRATTEIDHRVNDIMAPIHHRWRRRLVVSFNIISARPMCLAGRDVVCLFSTIFWLLRPSNVCGVPLLRVLKHAFVRMSLSGANVSKNFPVSLPSSLPYAASTLPSRSPLSSLLLPIRAFCVY